MYRNAIGEQQDPAASLGLVGSAEEDAAAAKIQAVQRGRSARVGVLLVLMEDKELARARKKFDQMDTNGNGMLDAAELKELVRWVFDSFHRNDIRLPADRQQKEAEKLTKKLDADGDNKLSFDEFAAWYKTTTLDITKYRKAQKKRAARKKGKKDFSPWIKADKLDCDIPDEFSLTEDDFAEICRKNPWRTEEWFEKLTLTLAENRGCHAGLRRCCFGLQQ